MKGISKAAKGRPKGAKAGFSSQLSELQKLILLWMLVVEIDLRKGTEEEQVEVKNRGILWSAVSFLESPWMPWLGHMDERPAGPTAPALSRALHRLEDRELITAQAEGKGRNRRLTYLKFSAPARAIASIQLTEAKEFFENAGAIVKFIEKHGEEEATRLTLEYQALRR